MLFSFFEPNYPPPPSAIPPPQAGDRHFTVLLSISIAVVRVPPFPLLQISHLCVFCDYLSPKAMYRVLCPFFRPNMFSPGDCVWYHSRTLGAHVLATVVGPSPNGPQFCHIQCIRPGGITHVDHESARLSRLEAVVVASPMWLHLCSVCLHQWRVPQFALKYPCNLPPGGGGGRPSRAT